MPMQLHYRKYGDGGEPLIILHGLFGSSDNWHSLARKWSTHYQVFVPDLRNHGSSPHESVMTYQEMAADVHAFIKHERLGAVRIVGHSMGGKVAMLFASLHPDVLKGLVVLDIGIGRVKGKHLDILQILNDIDPGEFTNRSDIDEQLAKTISSPPLRQFLLKNILRRVDGSLAWKFNAPVLLDQYDEITAELDLEVPFIGQILFLRGENSDYLEPSLSPDILDRFPLAQLTTIKDAGHWLHADAPDELTALVLDFMESCD